MIECQTIPWILFPNHSTHDWTTINSDPHLGKEKNGGIIVCPYDKGMTHEDNNLRHGREKAYFEIIE